MNETQTKEINAALATIMKYQKYELDWRTGIIKMCTHEIKLSLGLVQPKGFK